MSELILRNQLVIMKAISLNYVGEHRRFLDNQIKETTTTLEKNSKTRDDRFHELYEMLQLLQGQDYRLDNPNSSIDREIRRRADNLILKWMP